MTSLHSYKDSNSQCWANIRMDNGDPIWISIAQTGVIVKKSKIGLFGPKLFVSQDVYHAAQTAKRLDQVYDNHSVISDCDISNPVLKAFVNTCLHCATIEQATIAMNETA
jgi:hypothetical protein